MFMIVRPTMKAFRNMAMRKNGNASYSSGTVKIVNWLPAVEYPGSTVTSDSLGPSIGNGTKSLILQARMDGGSGFVQAATIDIMKNASTVIGSMTIPAATTAVPVGLTVPNVPVATGDIFWLRVTYNGGGWSRNLIAADTFLIFG